VIYNVKVLSLSWYADSSSPYNIFINVYMIIYIWKGSISVNIKVVSWMGMNHFHRKQVYTNLLMVLIALVSICVLGFERVGYQRYRKYIKRIDLFSMKMIHPHSWNNFYVHWYTTFSYVYYHIYIDKYIVRGTRVSIPR
jgi:hypothetical protein